MSKKNRDPRVDRPLPGCGATEPLQHQYQKADLQLPEVRLDPANVISFLVQGIAGGRVPSMPARRSTALRGLTARATRRWSSAILAGWLSTLLRSAACQRRQKEDLAAEAAKAKHTRTDKAGRPRPRRINRQDAWRAYLQRRDQAPRQPPPRLSDIRFVADLDY